MIVRAFLFAALALFTLSSTSLTAGTEDRTLLALNTAEKAKVRSEMRELLVSVSEIIAALDKKNMAEVEAAARKSGMVMVGQVEVSLKERLTPEFMKLGKSVHVGFDAIADAAKTGGSQEDIIGLLAEQTNRCTTCHSSFGLQ